MFIFIIHALVYTLSEIWAVCDMKNISEWSFTAAVVKFYLPVFGSFFLSQHQTEHKEHLEQKESRTTWMWSRTLEIISDKSKTQSEHIKFLLTSILVSSAAVIGLHENATPNIFFLGLCTNHCDCVIASKMQVTYTFYWTQTAPVWTHMQDWSSCPHHACVDVASERPSRNCI